jgi:hypothetical protein
MSIQYCIILSCFLNAINSKNFYYPSVSRCSSLAWQSLRISAFTSATGQTIGATTPTSAIWDSSKPLRGYAYNVTYTPSRYSVTILAGLFYPFGILGLQLLIPLSLLLWTWGLVRLFVNISSLSSYPLSTFHAVLLSCIIVYFSIYLAPHLYQSVYWNTGFFTYTFPSSYSLGY